MKVYNIHYGPGRPVRRLVLDGPHRGDVVLARPGMDHATVRLMRWWDYDGAYWARQSSPVLYYRVTYGIRTSEAVYWLEAYSRDSLHPDERLAQVALWAEVLLTS